MISFAMYIYQRDLITASVCKNHVLLKERTFAVFAVPLVSIITNADFIPSTIVAFGVLMASVSWVRFSKQIVQHIYYMIRFTKDSVFFTNNIESSQQYKFLNWP